MFDHPADKERTRFDELAEQISNATSTPVFFALVLLLGGIWGVGFAIGASESVKHFLEGLMAFLSLLLVAILKNSERRAEGVMHQKLDALLASEMDRRGQDVDDVDEELREALGRHDEV